MKPVSSPLVSPTTVRLSEIRKLHRVKPPPPRLVDIRNYKSYDTALFKDDLQHVPWDIPEQDKATETPDEVWNSFKDHSLTVVDKHAPVVTRRVRGKTLPWLTPEIKNLMQERERCHKKGYKDKQTDSLEQLQTATKCSYSEAPQRKSRFYFTRLSEDQNSRNVENTKQDIAEKKKNCG